MKACHQSLTRLPVQGCQSVEVSITHTDQLSNQWDELFQTVSTMREGHLHVRALGQGGNVFSYASARDTS